ncbi:hypothetical protein B0187_06745 [Haemophilus paracuniculus]|uniref:Uncharacterized protein n=1 Tax=Haemophilus paracuniculus TaxID=734 RepID=A0A1T0ARP8_9PAST|nr:hypothetical protein [Haemophilus paracuniculus]OOR98954.1 hypothetical protein B0187_06745 [Haemophilus paracuniculus]
MKRYRFTVAAKLSKTGTRQLLSNIIATGIVDAKNQVKEMFPEATIYSCTRNEEYIDPKQRAMQSQTKSSNDEQNSSSLGGMLLGAAITAGIGLFLKKK